MKNRSKKILSLLLALVMVFSLLPMQAFAVGESRNTGVARKDLKPLPLPDCPAQTLVSDEIDGLTVTVEAPKGALPWGVEMNVTKLENLDAVQAAVDAMEDVDGEALVAADITFVSEGKEIQPKKDVTVTMQAKELQNKDDLTVVHLDASAEDLQGGEDAEAEPVEGVSADELNAVTFEASHFSVYAVIGEIVIDDEAGSIDFESENYVVTVTYPEEAHIPVGTVLTVSEIPFGSDEYYELRAAAQDKLNENAVFGGEIDPDTRRGVGDAIFVDISLEFNGQPFEPAVPLGVKITLKDNALFCPAGEDAYVVHFGADGTELIEDVAVTESDMVLPDGMPEGTLLDSFDYEQTGFSAVGLFATDKFVDSETAVQSSGTHPIILPKADQISAGKTVTDQDGDGIYELALSVTGKADTTTTTEVDKSNVILVIDVSGSMDGTVFSEYTYDANTYSSSNTYRSSASTNGTRVYYSTSRNNWYTTQNPTYYSSPYTGTVYVQETRMIATQRAACKLVDTLLANNTATNPDIIEISVIKFASLEEDEGYYYGEYYYYNATELLISKSVDGAAIKQKINDLTEGGGTNWAAALKLAKSEADTKYKTQDQEGESTSIIFLTDGLPTFYLNSAGTAESGSGSEGNNNNRNNVSDSFNGAKPYARAIIRENGQDTGYTLYSIFAYGNSTGTGTNSANGARTLNNLTHYAYTGANNINWNTNNIATNEHYFTAQNTEDLEEAFETIAHNISDSVGFAGVSVSDGVSLGATNTSVAVGGTVDNGSMRYTVSKNSVLYEVKFDNSNPAKATFTIYGDGDPVVLTDAEPETVVTTIGETTITSKVYSVTVGTGENAKTYMMSPATIDPDTGMVKWDLAGLGILEDGVTYKLSFDVWPNQVAYDIAADLNNGIYADIDEAIAAYVAAGVIANDAREIERIHNALHHNDDGSYDIQTNYMQQVEYYPAEATTDEQTGETVMVYGDKQTQPLQDPPAIPLEGSSLPLNKIWEADLAESELNELLWVNGEIGGTSTEYGITLHVWKADTEAELEAMYTQPISATNQPYQSYDLGWDETVEGVDKYVWERDMAVAPGMLVNLAEAEYLGFDVTDTSRIVSFTPDPTEAEPNPEAQLYYVVEQGHYYYVTEDGADLHFELFTHVYHPMIVDGHLYDLTIDSSTTPYATLTEKEPMAAVRAENYLKGGLNVRKVVTDFEENPVEGVKDEFAFIVKLWKEDEDGNISPVYTYDDQFESNYKAISGSIGYREFGEITNEATGERVTLGRNVVVFEDTPNAAEKIAANKRGTNEPVYATLTEDNKTQIILRIPADGELRLVNLPRDTKYSVEEVVDTSDDAVYEYFKTVSAIKGELDEEGGSASGVVETVTGTSTSNTVSGSITGNKANIETYYNKTDSYFYVYHSSDNSIEKISFTDNRVKGSYNTETGTYTYAFNIAHETLSGCLYGGYYLTDDAGKGYVGAALTDAQIVALTYAAKEGSTELAYADAREGGYWASDAEGTAYNGSVANQWILANAATASGLAATPKAGTVYYLKEVPDTTYLRPYLHYTYHLYDGHVSTAWLISDVDDLNYNETGFVIITDNNEAEGVVKSLKVETTNGGNSVTLSPRRVFKAYSNNYLTYLTVINLGKNGEDPVRLLNKDDEVLQYWITPDNLMVTGTMMRSYAQLGDSTQIAAGMTEENVGSTVKEPPAPSEGD